MKADTINLIKTFYLMQLTKVAQRRWISITGKFASEEEALKYHFSRQGILSSFYPYFEYFRANQIPDYDPNLGEKYRNYCKVFEIINTKNMSYIGDWLTCNLENYEQYFKNEK